MACPRGTYEGQYGLISSLMIWKVGQSIQMIENWDKCLMHSVYLYRLEKWANRNAMKFEKGKCESSSWRRIIMFTKVGADWMESRFAEKGLGVLVNNRLDVTQQCALAPEHLELHEVLPAG